MHFGAKNGNVKICEKIIREATSCEIVESIINCRNSEGLTPLILVAWRGYHTAGDKEEAIDNRCIIIERLLKAGAKPNYHKNETQMTAMHWLAYNNDHFAIEVLLRNGGDNLIMSHDGLLPIDIAGTTPSLKCVDVFLEHYTEQNKLSKPRPFHHDYTTIEKFLDYEGPT